MAASSNPIAGFLLIVFYFFGAPPSAAPQAGMPLPAGHPSSFRIAGTVVSKTDGRLLARARITVRDVKDAQKFQSLITSDNGRFEFDGLPAGKYSLTGAKRGFISAAYDQHDQFSTAIVTGAGLDTETLTLKLAPDAVVTGKVLDEFGDPVRHAMVMLYYVDHSGGVDQIHQFRSAQTDDLGEYEMTPLIPGTYFLSANAKPWYAVHPSADRSGSNEEQIAPAPVVDRSLDVAYPITYYPDVIDADSATPIPIRGGDRMQVDVHLNPVPALHLFFRVPGNGKNGFNYPQFQQPAFEGSTYINTEGGRMVSPGLWEITGIPAGRYNLRLPNAGSTLQMNGIDLTKDGEELDTSGAEASSAVKFSLQIPGESDIPSQMMVGLRTGKGVAVAWHAVSPKGEVQLEQIPSGQYEVVVQGPKRYSIAHMAAEGAEVSGHILKVPAGSSPSVALTLVAGSAEVEGIAKRAGNGFSGAMVVLVPKNPEMNRDLFRRDQSDLDGTFVLYAVVPGSYTLLAIDNGWDLDWSQPGVIAAYLKPGRTIQVGEVGGRAVKVEESIEVQSK
jgi:Carboxypeptidase regulatory-like domain